MTGKRYYKKDWEESYYIFDSNTISENEFEERVEYEGYDVFGDSLTGSEIIGLLNENKQLKQQIKYLRITVKSVINDLKRMDTYRYAEHLEKITNLRFVSEKELQE